MSRALIVDDTPLGRHALTEEMRAAGFDVHESADAYEALALIPELEPSVLIVDFQLPGIDGIALIERIRTFSEVPAILITAYGSPSLTERGKKAGVQAILDFNRDLASVGPRAMDLVRASAEQGPTAIAANPKLLRRRRDALKRAELEKVLLETHGNISEAARRINMSRGSLRYQMRRLGLWTTPGTDPSTDSPQG